jgi:hypothetical protein
VHASAALEDWSSVTRAPADDGPEDVPLGTVSWRNLNDGAGRPGDSRGSGTSALVTHVVVLGPLALLCALLAVLDVLRMPGL